MFFTEDAENINTHCTSIHSFRKRRSVGTKVPGSIPEGIIEFFLLFDVMLIAAIWRGGQGSSADT
jgi:hypothetical protein